MLTTWYLWPHHGELFRIFCQVLYSNANEINVTCNLNKTVCMMFKPKNRNRIIADVFPKLSVGDCCIDFVTT